MAMEPSPTPTKGFHVWGGILVRISSSTGSSKTDPDAHRMLFAVSDDEQKWLAWYFFNGGKVIDYLILANAAPQGIVWHKLVGAAPHHPGKLNTTVPITVEELGGPVMWARGGNGRYNSRKASIYNPRLSDSSVHLRMKVQHKTGVYDFPLILKREQNFETLASNLDEPGLVQWIMTERFSSPVAHSVINRFQVWMRKLLTS